MWWAAEDSLSECGERDLLIEKGLVLLQQRYLGNVSGKNIIRYEIATVEREQQVA